MSVMENAGTEKIKDIGWHGSTSTKAWDIGNTTTKRKMSVPINCISRKGHDSEKSTNDLRKESQNQNNSGENDDPTEIPKTKKRKSKQNAREEISFDSDPKKLTE